MLYLYQNSAGFYQVINDVESVEIIIFESKDKASAVAAFNARIADVKKTTLMTFDGVKVMDVITKTEIK